MFLGLFFLLFAYACFNGLVSSRNLPVWVVLVGFFQDPTRKLMDGEPVLMTILVGIVLLCIFFRQTIIERRSLVSPFTNWNTSMITPLTLYLSLVFVQAIHSFIRYESLLLTGLGAIFYIAPLIAIIVGYRIFFKFDRITSFLYAYCVCGTLVACSILMSYFGVQSDLLGEVGSGLVIYDQGTVLKAYSGLMRSSEIASWHISACVCFLIILLSHRASFGSSLLTTILVFLLVSAVILTGRRKSIVQILVFTSLYLPLLRYFQGRLSNGFLALCLILAAGLYAATIFVPSLQGTQYDLYLARGASVFEDVGGRFSQLGIGSIFWAYRVHGLFGGGLGVASQGAQHFVEGYASGAGEGGLGKIVAELGLIALFILLWLGVSVASYLHKALMILSKIAPNSLAISVGVLAFLIANIPSFIVASQAYGDVFILLILGLLSSSLFAVPLQLASSIQVRRSSMKGCTL